MADVVSFTTWPKHQNPFYMLQTNFVNFEVKAPRNALLKLGRKPNIRSDILIGIGDGGNSCWIMKDENNVSSAFVDNVITSMQYRRFWVTWTGGLIKLGCDGETTPIVTLTNEYPDLSYVAFGVLREINPVEWKLELPPVITTPECKLISGGKLKWVRAEDQLPVGALIGGFENETLYIIRAAHMHSLTPGKFVSSQGTAYIPWGGNEHPKSEFEVLCGYNCTWVQTCGDRVPVGAFAGGFSEVHHETLYIGRVEHNGHLIPGKVAPSHKVCYISFVGKEIAKNSFEILIDSNVTVDPTT
ncbi:uncharacterized protein LOC113230218 isoform X2 [Hyposmocoma kahamanoa]|uniref:uncharacterized protein LOC113230218 isoform X2 n=1 Tax=Hyposmocoma kahamanoa TaxID=1477025 RepID=UPI000E6D5E4B|nr:uncharacterized protein LOC113230218 isoform X2 [Hyposmocoma kahamanoa]